MDFTRRKTDFCGMGLGFYLVKNQGLMRVNVH